MKIQRYEGTADYGDRSLNLGGYSQKKSTYRGIKLLIIGALCLCVLAALNTTLLSKIPLFILPAGRPPLCLLFVLACGYLLGEKEGCVCGLMGGFMAECADMTPLLGGIMLLPLIYCILGYVAGALADDWLAKNLPSFEVYALLGIFISGMVDLLLSMIKGGDISFMHYLLGSLLPELILALLTAPILYGFVYLLKKRIDK